VYPNYETFKFYFKSIEILLMESFSIEQLSYSIVLVIGAVGGLFHVIQRSRCVKINCCGIKCDRNIDRSPEPDIEIGVLPQP
jgi:hypothetical protein